MADSPLPAVAPAPKRPSMVKHLARVTQDGWHNIVTGLGSFRRDKRMSSRPEFNIMTETEAEQIYASDDVAAKIVDALPEEA